MFYEDRKKIVIIIVVSQIQSHYSKVLNRAGQTAQQSDWILGWEPRVQATGTRNEIALPRRDRVKVKASSLTRSSLIVGQMLTSMTNPRISVKCLILEPERILLYFYRLMCNVKVPIELGSFSPCQPS